ncbi:hypothetical protein CJF42_21050 [Pseudoalteromonas sp. NBT06-2]|uniref:hypothetical protein n=1 Tax=Pseudoalteromonas sp. NBT06-2 TaxID=2025950 RepID=UPI000BA5678F|nr:hypothetical protein [Pseudoalteromonas sp. NBT06-2]PAJ72484.1 hypothetical protein CJF42_21050 [Pseudoalteromonas sp. NBT06-2]
MALEIIEEVAEELEEDAALTAEGSEISEASEVENSAEVTEAADSPELSENPQAAQTSSLGRKLLELSKKVGKFLLVEGAKAGVIFGIFYAVNKLLASDSKKTGKRTALSVYLKQVEENFKKQKLDFTPKVREATADSAVTFPWIDATK